MHPTFRVTLVSEKEINPNKYQDQIFDKTIYC